MSPGGALLFTHWTHKGSSCGRISQRWKAEPPYVFYLFLQQAPQRLIGSIALSNIVWGCFLSCFLGYKLDGDYTNNGYMTQAIKAVSRYAFDTLCLHRIEANVIPRNLSSRRVLEKCGFHNEGLSKSYLKINGVWEDHIHMVLLNDAV